MKSSFRFLLLATGMAALVASCKKPVPSQTKHIPKNATVVFSINAGSMQQKLADNMPALEDLAKNLAGNDTSVVKGKQELEDLKNAGLDLEGQFYVSVVQKGGSMNGAAGSEIAGFGGLKDADKFVAYLKKQMPQSEVRTEKDFSYVTKDAGIIAWQKDLVIMISLQQNAGMNNMEYDSATGSYNFKKPVRDDNQLKTEAAALFSLKEEESVASIPEFREMAQDKSDCSFWINSASSFDNIPLPLPKLKELFANTFTTGKLDFEDGQIDIKTRSYYSPQLRDILKSAKANDADMALIENYPSDNINGFAVFAFNPEVINQLVKYLEVGGVVDGALTQFMGTNYTLQEALKVIKGDFAFVASDFNMQNANMPNDNGMNAQVPRVQVLLNLPVGDPAQMHRVMDKFVEKGFLQKAGNGYGLNQQLAQFGYQLSVDDKNIVIASSAALLQQYKAGSKKMKLPGDVMDNMKSKPGIFYVNIESMLNGVPPSGKPSNDSIMQQAKATFKDMKGYSEHFDGKSAEGTWLIRFKNEKQNSLTSIIQFADFASKHIDKSGTTMAPGVLPPMPMDEDTVKPGDGQ